MTGYVDTVEEDLPPGAVVTEPDTDMVGAGAGVGEQLDRRVLTGTARGQRHRKSLALSLAMRPSGWCQTMPSYGQFVRVPRRTSKCSWMVRSGSRSAAHSCWASAWRTRV